MSETENICKKCKTKEHTREEHKKIARREYMREYMYNYTQDKVLYRRWPFIPKQ